MPSMVDKIIGTSEGLGDITWSFGSFVVPVVGVPNTELITPEEKTI